MTGGLRVLFDARMAHYRRAGIGQYAVSLLRAIADLPELGEGVRVDVLQMRADTRPIIRDLRFRRVAASTPPHNRFEQFALPVELLRIRPRPGVMHCPDFVPPRLRLFPAVANIQDLAFMKFPEITLLTGESKRYYGQVRWAARNADALIALSQSARDDIVTLLGVDAKKVAVIPAAADARFKPPDDFAKAREVADRRLGLGPKDGGYILFVGTIEPRKNLTTLVEAHSLLRERGSVRPMPALVVVGKKGWLSERLYERIEELGLREQVYFLHGVEDGDLPIFYGGARVFAFPSLYEGFGLPVLEAMASGTPVVTSNAGSLREVAGEAAVLVEPLDVEGWVEALERALLDDGASARLREEGPRRAAEFSWERAARDTVGLYRRVVGSR